MYPGAGYGGSCFPKDVKALSKIGKSVGYEMQVVDAVDKVNERQKEVVFNKISKAFSGDLEGKVIAMWGLSFKPETDDMREAPSLTVINKLLENGAIVRVFDPVAMQEAQRRLGDKVIYCTNKYDAVDGAHAVALLTEWKQFRLSDWAHIKNQMTGNVVVDGRNILDAEELQELGFKFSKIGREF